jgi:hypothetical protein
MTFRVEQHGDTVETVPHVCMTERQMDLHRSASRVPLSLGDVLPDNLRIAAGAGRREHAPAVRRLDRYNACRNLQDILQH